MKWLFKAVFLLSLAGCATAPQPGSGPSGVWRAVRVQGATIERPRPELSGRHMTKGSPILSFHGPAFGTFFCSDTVGDFAMASGRIVFGTRRMAPNEVVVMDYFRSAQIPCEKLMAARTVRVSERLIQIFEDYHPASDASALLEFAPDADVPPNRAR